MRSFRARCIAVTMGAAAFHITPAAAQETTPTDPGETTSLTSPTVPSRTNLTYLDLTASIGYASNPFLEFDNSNGATFGRASARGVHSWGDDRGRTSLTGFVEGTTYFNSYGLKSIFQVTADTQRKFSETVTGFGSLGFSGDLSGQLGNRFLYSPGQVIVPDPNLPPTPVPVQDPTLFSFAGRQYQLYGQAGASINTSLRSSFTFSGGAQRLFYTSNVLGDYTTVFGNGAYNHTLSERATIGASVSANQTVYDGSSDKSTILNTALTARLLLSETWAANGSIGVSFSKFDRLTGNGNSTNLSFDGSICRTGPTERFCARAARYMESQSRTSLVTTNSIGVNWFKLLGQNSSIQLAADYIHYTSDLKLLPDLKSDYFNVSGSYNRSIGNRVSAGVDVSARRLVQTGPDPDIDVSGSLFVRYRLGDL